jgi:dsRNA-specific ribonuclease
MGKGSGSSKKEAEQAAAREALEHKAEGKDRNI